MNRENQKIVIISGASSGFGRAAALKFAQSGWRVIALARRLDRLKELQQQLGESNCDIFEFDVCQQSDIDTLAGYLEENKIAVDLLLNNAGLALGLDSADNASPEDWRSMVDTNINGLIFMTRAILPRMVAAGHGHIINIGSIAGTYAYPGGNVYGASKAFVAQFSLNLRADLAGSGVRVTNIEPGLAQTEFSDVRFHGDSEKAKSVYQGVTPLSAEDIAEAIVWSASRPAHVNINRIEIMPTCQAFSPLSIAHSADSE